MSPLVRLPVPIAVGGAVGSFALLFRFIGAEQAGHIGERAQQRVTTMMVGITSRPAVLRDSLTHLIDERRGTALTRKRRVSDQPR